MSSRKNVNDNSMFIHPFNFFIMQNIGSINGYLNNNNILDAGYVLHDFLMWLDPEIKDVLVNERQILKAMVQGKKPITEGFVYDLIDKVSLALHIAGYFTAAKWGVTTKPSNLKDLRIKLEKAVYGKQIREEKEAQAKAEAVIQ